MSASQEQFKALVKTLVKGAAMPAFVKQLSARECRALIEEILTGHHKLPAEGRRPRDDPEGEIRRDSLRLVGLLRWVQFPVGRRFVSDSKGFDGVSRPSAA